MLHQDKHSTETRWSGWSESSSYVGLDTQDLKGLWCVLGRPWTHPTVCKNRQFCQNYTFLFWW